VTYDGEEISVDALAERIDTVERDIENDAYHIWTKKLPVSSRETGSWSSSRKRPTKTKRIRSSTSLRTKSTHRPST